MIKIFNTNGNIGLTTEFFATLASNAIADCYGVAGMATSGPFDSASHLLFGEKNNNYGVTVRLKDSEIVMRLHLKLVYGVNIPAVADSVRNRVSYAIEDATHIKVSRIDIFVDDIVVV